MRGLTIVADYFVICTAGSATNARAIADHVTQQMKQAAQRPAIGTEGRESGWWVLSDFGDVVVHVFQDDARQYYAIDQTWADAPAVESTEAA